MDAIQRELIMQRWNVIQYELMPELRSDVGTLTPKREKVIPTFGNCQSSCRLNVCV